MAIVFAVTIFTSAFLLFQIQPLIGKIILPWFGGGPAVWGVSLLFFQSCLLAGYLYAHLLVKRLRIRQQAIVHLLLLATALTQLPVGPSEAIQPSPDGDPTLQILAVLTRTIGLPFFALSATAPLIQVWVSGIGTVANPYRLYALSNAASLLALLSYPFLIEPLLTRQTQTLAWSAIFGVFLLLCGYCAAVAGFRSTGSSPVFEPEPSVDKGPDWKTWLLWLTLPATAVALLLGVTNQVTRDLVSLPFLWVLPLSVYLLSFIICFDGEHWYRRIVFFPAMLLSIAVMLYLLTQGQPPVIESVIAYTVSLFILCMVAHGELNRLRPDPVHLTGFYLMIALGGALGSALVAVVMPMVSDRYLELQVGIAGLAILVAIVLERDKTSRWPMRFARPARITMFAAIALLGGFIVRSAQEEEPDILYQTRNFFGVLTVGRDDAGTEYASRWLRNGNSYHGAQFTAPQHQSEPISYYSRSSGVALALGFSEDLSDRRIGMVGLGVGSIAGYMQAGDYLRIYEINPAVVDIATSHFTFLANSAAEYDVIPGDARLSLAHESDQAFDVFILDAFSSDSIPVHLLTREAFELYLRHLEPDGVIAVLISSWYFDFEPLLREMADAFAMEALLVSGSSPAPGDWGSDWMIMTRNEQFMAQVDVRRLRQHQSRRRTEVRLWTDDFSSPFQLLKR